MIKLNHRMLARKAQRFGVDRIARVFGSWKGLTVLTYHRIGNAEECDYDRGVFSVTTKMFQAQMKYLRDHFEIVSIDEVLNARPESFVRRQAVLVTFDDGYIDNYVNAFPILKHFEIPALFFVTTGFLDDQCCAWWDEIAWMRRHGKAAFTDQDSLQQLIESDLEQYYRLPSSQTDVYLNAIAKACGVQRLNPPRVDHWMNWEMVREMSQCGMSFGGHTVTHSILTRSENNWEFELSEGKRRIEHETGKPVRAFSYPVGTSESFDDTLKNVVSEFYEMAFSCYGGTNNSSSVAGWNAYEMRRWPVWGSIHQFRTTITWPQLLV